MTRDPLSNVVDAPLFIVPRVLDRLRAYQAAAKCEGVTNAPGERARIAAEIDRLVDILLDGVERHPTKMWVLRQFQKTLEVLKDIEGEDAPVRAQVRGELEKLMDILGIGSADGVLGYNFR